MSKTSVKTTTKPEVKSQTGRLLIQAVAQDIERESTGKRPSIWRLGEAHELYERIFWPAYLGIRPFGLYDQLRQHVTAVAAGYIERPTVQALADILGGRGAVLGRAQVRGRKAQAGMLQQLSDEMVIRLRTSGRDRQRNYQFGVLLQLPALTPYQSAQLPQRWAEQHERFLGALRGFDLPAWREIGEKSLVPDMVSASGWAWFDPAGAVTQVTAVSGTLASMALSRDANHCRLCGHTAVRADFIVPQGMGGLPVLDNVIAVCDDCLLRKNGRTPEQAGMLLRPGG